MPTGIEAFQRKQAAKKQQQAAQGGGGSSIKADWFGLKGGTFAVVRFLEQGNDLTFADVHRIPVGRRWPADFICLDTNDDGTPCPACQSENNDIRRRTTKGFLNLIWREGPVYERNDFGTPKKNGTDPIITGRADGVFLWKCSGTVYQELVEKDSKYKGLMSRDFEIKRVGTTKDDTKYFIDPADVDGGQQPMTIADQALAEKKYNLIELTTPLSFQDFSIAMVGAPATEGPQPTMDRSQLTTADNVFQGAPPVRASAFTRG
jgi:hypothetical protein